MKYAVISDVHANHPALLAVFRDIRAVGADAVVCLGDVVGYNCFPHETIGSLRERLVPTVHGNHDLLALSDAALPAMGPNGTRALTWTRGVLTEAEREYLAALPGSLPLGSDCVALHSRLGNPYARMRSDEDFAAEAARLRSVNGATRLALIGHTHVPGVVAVARSGTVKRHAPGTRNLDDDSFHFVNPGSVGHPRRSDYRASYCLYDLDRRRVEFRRVRYDRDATVRTNAVHGVHTDLGPSVLRFALQRMWVRRASE